ncbi:Ku protein [Streptomyces hoynatensis]|uniref:Non-homologous end joining protein Ku n=1 Tax=Streptomyces hoynatensis TaxID=1141874 RepID=A0A3A9Z908_9ACTN|nr:Ku protein [Streptomyces hoynatensis]RKN43796.1 Ku protein [Streptomyces hoynatensis]
MARAIWSGVLTFGLVTVPVQLFTATEDHTVHFRQFQRGTSDRVRRKRVNERTGEEVAYDEIVKGYDLGGGDYVIVEPGELNDVAPGKSQTIDVSGFVALDRIEPVFFDRTYYLAPKGEEYTGVYALLRTALDEAGKAGVATFVMRGKQYLIALRAQTECLVLHTLHWADEVRDPAGELPVLPGRKEGRGRELDTARELIDALSIDWRPEDYHDTYEERVRELIEAKAEGREIVAAEGPPEATGVVDLMDALRASVDRSRERPSRGGGGTGEVRELREARRRAGGGRRRGDRPARGRKRKDRPAPGGGEDLARLSKKELYRRAGELGVRGRSTMDRGRLAQAVARAAEDRAAS